MFFVGVVTWWSVAGELPASVFWSIIGLALGSLAVTYDPRAIVSVLTALTIFVAWRRGRLSSWLGGPVLQYFGRISYSLYLIHPFLGHRLIRFARNQLGELSAVEGVGLFSVATAASILAAHLLHVSIERPTLALSKRITLLPRAEEPQ